MSYIGETAQRFTDRANQHQYCARTENYNNGFFVHAAHHHGVGEKVERGTGDRWSCSSGMKLSSWMPIAIAREGKSRSPFTSMPGSLMNLERGARVDPCWGALNDLILEEGERRVKARQKWVRRFGKKMGAGKGGRISWSKGHDSGGVTD